MGIETIPDRGSGQRGKFSWLENLRQSFVGTFAPRGISGIPRANYGRLGSSTYPWKRAHIQMGYLGIGDVFAWHDYAGNVDVPQGYMLCNGVIVSQANYDAQHAAGDWANYIGTSPIATLYLPDMDQTYIKGKSGTLQAGTVAITKVGANTQNFQHNHGSPKTTTAAGGSVYNNNGNDSAGGFMVAFHTHGFTIPNALSATQDIRPSSSSVKFIMRIV